MNIVEYSCNNPILLHDDRSISTEDVVRGRYTSVGRYIPRIDLIQKLQLLYY
jgi:hypothetical protein